LKRELVVAKEEKKTKTFARRAFYCCSTQFAHFTARAQKKKARRGIWTLQIYLLLYLTPMPRALRAKTAAESMMLCTHSMEDLERHSHICKQGLVFSLQPWQHLKALI